MFICFKVLPALICFIQLRKSPQQYNCRKVTDIVKAVYYTALTVSCPFVGGRLLWI